MPRRWGSGRTKWASPGACSRAPRPMTSAPACLKAQPTAASACSSARMPCSSPTCASSASRSRSSTSSSASAWSSAALLSKGKAPDALYLTATPIPRTLALAVFGDMTLSYIKHRPNYSARRTTHVVSKADQGRAYDAARDAFARGEQVYVVCPLVGQGRRRARRARPGTDGSGAEDADEAAYEPASVSIEDERRPGGRRRGGGYASEASDAAAVGVRGLARWSCCTGKHGARREGRRRHGPVPRRARRRCSWRPPSSRWAWTCPTPRS